MTGLLTRNWSLHLTATVAAVFYEIASHMENELRASEGKFTQQYDNEGVQMLWSYSKLWTEEFMQQYPEGTFHDGNLIDNVEAFVKQKIENLQ